MLARRLLAVLRNAIAWGIGWFLAAAAVVTVMLLAGVAPRDATWLRAFGLAARVGVVGGMAGASFALATILFYRGRRLRDLHWARFGLAGAVVSATVIPLVLQGLNILSGDGMVPWSQLTDDIPLLAVLGGSAAGAWLKLAQRGEGRLHAPSASATGPDDGRSARIHESEARRAVSPPLGGVRLDDGMTSPPATGGLHAQSQDRHHARHPDPAPRGPDRP